MGVLVPGIHYAQEAQVSLPTNPVRVLRLTDPLMRGEQVTRVQRTLKAAGYHPGSIDGVYGPKTTAAVYAYQVSKGLVPDGECGPATARSLKVTWP